MTKIVCLKIFLFFQHPYFDKRYRYRQYRSIDPVSFNACGKSFIYIKKRSGPRTDACGTPQFISPASEETFSSVKKKFV